MLTINDIRGNANAFVKEWQGETREDAERQSFWNDFFEIFGIKRRRFVTFERNVTKLKGTPGRIDAFWPGNLLVEHKSAGQDLDKAMDQAEGYLNTLAEEELPRLIVLSDFARFRVLNLETGDEVEFPLAELPDHIETFTFLAGYRPRWFEDQAEVNVKAAALMGKIYDRLAENGYDGEQLNLLLVRLVFLMFADDTGLWGETGLFEDYLERKTNEDGSDLGPRLGQLFELLDTPNDKRQSAIEESLQSFPYINGHLFTEQLPLAAFDAQTREQLLLACRFNWSKISPAIFGSMFQSVMDPEARHALGAHYTTERNIMKTIGPLFVDELEEQLEKAGKDRAKLKALFEHLRELTFFDPACGSGNFLVIAYRELRRIELEVLKRLRKLDKSVSEGQLTTQAMQLSQVDVDQFYGIEIEEFPARIAEVAMYLMDHLANQKLGEEFGLTYSRIPLHTPAHIHVGNALTMDWSEVIRPSDCSFVFGNPPFVAAKSRTPEQSEEMVDLFGGSPAVDYVGAWFVKASRFIKGTDTRAAFVATNSIVQGEQVGRLWPLIFEFGVSIDFAHRTFRWVSDAPGGAAVYVVIIGFSDGGKRKPKVIYEYAKPTLDEPHELVVQQINAYLADTTSTTIPSRRSSPFGNAPLITEGNKPADGGYLLLSEAEYENARTSDPVGAKYAQPYVGGKELLNGGDRWCLWLKGADPADLRQSQLLRERLHSVRDFRSASKKASTRALAETPSLFDEDRQPQRRFLCMPMVSSEARRWIPSVFVEPSTIISNKTLAVEGCDIFHFGLLHSSMWMAWVRAIGGRLEMRYQLSAKVVYNTFPWPDEPSSAARKKVEEAAQAVLDARDAHPGNTLADLYNPDGMPKDLLQAHTQLDKAVDALFGKGSFDEAKRLALLLKRYEEMTAAAA